MKSIWELKRHKHLNEYTNEELLEDLGDIESTEVSYLACICAEILRRQLCKTDTHK